MFKSLKGKGRWEKQSRYKCYVLWQRIYWRILPMILQSAARQVYRPNRNDGDLPETSTWLPEWWELKGRHCYFLSIPENGHQLKQISKTIRRMVNTISMLDDVLCTYRNYCFYGWRCAMYLQWILFSWLTMCCVLTLNTVFMADDVLCTYIKYCVHGWWCVMYFQVILFSLLTICCVILVNTVSMTDDVLSTYSKYSFHGWRCAVCLQRVLFSWLMMYCVLTLNTHFMDDTVYLE